MLWSRSAAVALRAVTILTRIEAAIAVTALFVTGLALVSDIIAREVFRQSLFGSLRVAVYGTAIAALVGFNVCTAANGHMRVTAFDGLVPERWRPLVMQMGDLVSFIICAVFVYFSVHFVWQTYSLGETDVALRIFVWPMQLALPWLFISSGMRYLAFAIFPEIRPREAELAS